MTTPYVPPTGVAVNFVFDVPPLYTPPPGAAVPIVFGDRPSGWGMRITTHFGGTVFGNYLVPTGFRATKWPSGSIYPRFWDALRERWITMVEFNDQHFPTTAALLSGARAAPAVMDTGGHFGASSFNQKVTIHPAGFNAAHFGAISLGGPVAHTLTLGGFKATHIPVPKASPVDYGRLITAKFLQIVFPPPRFRCVNTVRVPSIPPAHIGNSTWTR